MVMLFMTDHEFLHQFENCTLPKADFTHRNHLRLAWLYLSKIPLQEALIQISLRIQRYAISINASNIYHETLTHLWIYLVYQAMRKKNANFDNFIANNQYLLDKKLPEYYYSASLLASTEARKQWIAPDVKPLDINVHL